LPTGRIILVARGARRDAGIPGVWDARIVAYAVGQTIEVCLALDPPPARGIRRIVCVLVGERGRLWS
jgi:hypothetical protein